MTLQNTLEQQAQFHRFDLPQLGDPCGYVKQQGHKGPIVLDSLAGRYVLLCFYRSLSDPLGRAAVEALSARAHMFDGERICAMAVSVDANDEKRADRPALDHHAHYLWDFDVKVCSTFRTLALGAGASLSLDQIAPCWILIDPTWHVLATVPFRADGSDRDDIFKAISQLPEPNKFAPFELPPPILILPHVFDPNFCAELIRMHTEAGAVETGVMRNATLVLDRSYKSRTDYNIKDKALQRHIDHILQRRVYSQIKRYFSCDIAYLERYTVGCYDANSGGFFRPHRDNNEHIVGYRKFALSINLNADFEGGAVIFPEYGKQGYKAPPGWAVVFPCALLHAVGSVTAGRRYAFISFAHDEAGEVARLAVASAIEAAKT